MIQALGEFICVQPFTDAEKKTESGIYLAEEERKRKGDIVYCAKGHVINWGDAVDLDVKANDVVYYNPYDVSEINSKYHVVNYKLIKAVEKDA